MVLAKPTVAIEYVKNYIDSKIVITISNPNSVGTLNYRIELQNFNNSKLLETFSNDTSENVISIEIPIAKYYDVEVFYISYTVTVEYYNDLNLKYVAELCENTKLQSYRPAVTLAKDTPWAYLKAFGNFPKPDGTPLYAYWETSTDGIIWDPCEPSYITVESLTCSVFIPSHDSFGSIDNSNGQYAKRTVYKVSGGSVLDDISARIDCIFVNDLSKMYKINLVTLRDVVQESDEYLDGVTKTVDVLLSSAIYTPLNTPKTELMLSDISNVSESSILYYGNTIYSYGKPKFKNYVSASFPGEIVRPVSNLIMLDVSNNTNVTTIVPWKSYLVCFTDSSIHLVQKQNTVFNSQTVNTLIGVPVSDSKCCKATLNGIIFKSDTKIYMLYPNLYSGSDSALNLTVLSEPISDILESYTPTEILPFAVSTENYYNLILPNETTSTVLKYNYLNKYWTIYEYPIVFDSYVFKNGLLHMLGTCKINDIYGEFLIDSTFDDDGTYADDLGNDIRLPISFALDSGQKADSLNNTRQFVESKFNLSTLHMKDSFPMKVTVHIDGMPYVTVKDINTDSAFWKTSQNDIGTLNTDFISDTSDIFNVFRQMFLRYSGKGRSIRHIIEGESVYPFRLYEINYRYKNINVKK